MHTFDYVAIGVLIALALGGALMSAFATSQFAPQIRHSRAKLGMGTPCIRRSLLLLSYKPKSVACLVSGLTLPIFGKAYDLLQFSEQNTRWENLLALGAECHEGRLHRGNGGRHQHDRIERKLVTYALQFLRRQNRCFASRHHVGHAGLAHRFAEASHL